MVHGLFMKMHRHVPSAEEALWVLRAQSGDRDALQRLLGSADEILRRYVPRMVAQSEVEDVIQDVLFLAYRKLEWLEAPELFRPWLFRIATRVAFRRLRISSRRQEASIEDLPETGAMAVHQPPPSRVEEILNASGIPPATRAVMVLHFQEGLTLADAAAVLGIPTGTAKSRLGYGLTKLRERFKHSQELP